jgi:uncharacterized membrane protein YjjP (DUF1212 family)
MGTRKKEKGGEKTMSINEIFRQLKIKLHSISYEPVARECHFCDGSGTKLYYRRKNLHIWFLLATFFALLIISGWQNFVIGFVLGMFGIMFIMVAGIPEPSTVRPQKECKA